MGTITMTGFSVDADGAVQIGSGSTGSLTIGSGTNGGKIHATTTAHELVIDPFATDSTNSTDASGVVTILGDLVVHGNTTTFHSNTVDISDHNLTLAKGTTSSGMANGAGITIGDGAYATFSYNSANSGSWETNVGLDVSGALAVSGALSGATSIDGTGDLTMGTITMTGFSVDPDGDTVTKSINNSSGGITNTGAIAGATTVAASGAVTGGSLTDGTATLASGALSGVTTISSTGATSLAINGGAVNIASTGVTTTVKGILNVEEAVTLDTTLDVTGDTNVSIIKITNKISFYN